MLSAHQTQTITLDEALRLSCRLCNKIETKIGKWKIGYGRVKEMDVDN